MSDNINNYSRATYSFEDDVISTPEVVSESLRMIMFSLEIETQKFAANFVLGNCRCSGRR